MKSMAKDLETTHTFLWLKFKELYPQYFSDILSIDDSIDISWLNNAQVNYNNNYNNNNNSKEIKKEGKQPHWSLVREFFDYFNLKLKEQGWIKRDLQLTHPRKRLIETRLHEGKTRDDLKLCADNFNGPLR